jgi:uncharacterized protein (TIRG00374 family)
VKKQFLIGLAKYGLGIGLLAWMLWRYWAPSPDGSSPGLSGIFQRPIQIAPLAAASLICLGSVLLTFYRWFLLVQAQKLECSPLNALRLGLIGYFLSNFLPGSVTGDVFKAAFLARQQARRTVAVATVMVDRAVGLWGLFWVLALVGAGLMLTGDPHGLLDKPILHKIVIAGFSLVGVTTVLWCVWLLLPARAAQIADWLDRYGRVGHSLAEFWRAMWMYRHQWRWVLLSLLISIVGHVGFALTFYYAAQTFAVAGHLDQIPTMIEHLLIVPVGLTFQALFPAPGGLGGAEAAFGQLYYFVIGTDLARDNGIAGSLTQRMINWALSLVGYLIYLRVRSEVPGIDEAVEETEHEALGTPEPVGGLPTT